MEKMNKAEFLKTELGASWTETIDAWDFYLGKHDYKETKVLQSRHEAFQIAVKQFYGIEYHFTRTDEHYGLVTEAVGGGEGEDWLYKKAHRED